jgi:hypothetical protein
MAENEKRVLSDKSVIPDDEHIFSLIGNNKVHWKRIMDHVAGNYKDTSGSWNYYNDGKQWLFKMVQKKKTIFWSGIMDNTFRITFYFGNKAEPIIENSDLPRYISDEFKTAKHYGLIRPVTFLIKSETDVDNVLKLIAIKSKMK